MKVSYIVPVYKVEQYLSQCVESVLAQTYTDFEILLVDDGSPDGSPVLCDEWAKRDVRVKALHKPNGGLSDARNYGLKHAQGDYVVFIDGDDFWQHKDDLEKLVKMVKGNPEVDFIGFNCDYYYPETNRFSPWVEYAETLSKTTNKNIATCELVKSGTFPMSACLKFLKRQFLIDNQLFFVKGQIAEDIPWFINVLDKSNKCMFINQYVYAYRQNVAGSITNSAGNRSFQSLLNIVETEIEKLTKRSLTEEAKNGIYSFLAYELSILFTNSNITDKDMERLKALKWLLNYDLNPKVHRVKLMKNLIGLTLTIKLLKLYNKHRASRN